MGLEQLAAAVAAGGVGQALADVRPPSGERPSAVLAAFTLLEDGEGVVLTERAGTLRKHAGQVAFPGGQLELGETNEEGALREAWEEAGIVPGDVHVFGALPSTHIPVSGFDVATVVGWWKTGEPTPGHRNEVAAVHVVPVADLADPDHRFTATTPTGFRTPGFATGGLFVWGFTAFILDELLRAGGWEQPWGADDLRPVPSHLYGKR